MNFSAMLLLSLGLFQVLPSPSKSVPSRPPVDPAEFAVAHGLLLAAYPELNDGATTRFSTAGSGSGLRITVVCHPGGRLRPLADAAPDLIAEFTFDERHALQSFAATGRLARSHERTELERAAISSAQAGDRYLTRARAAFGPAARDAVTRTLPLEALRRSAGNLEIVSATYASAHWDVLLRAVDAGDFRVVHAYLEPFSGRLIALDATGRGR